MQGNCTVQVKYNVKSEKIIFDWNNNSRGTAKYIEHNVDKSLADKTVQVPLNNIPFEVIVCFGADAMTKKHVSRNPFSSARRTIAQNFYR